MNRTVTAPSSAVARRRATTRARVRSAGDSCALADTGAAGGAAAGSIPPTILMTQLTPPTGPGPPGMTVVAAIVGAMGHAPTLDFDLSTLRRAIGGGSYVRGAEYAQQRAVLRVAWDPDGAALRGTVHGQGANVYHTSAYLTLPPGQPARFDAGECSCPVAYNCKHVVALVMSALAAGTMEPGPAASPSAPAPPAWDQSLDSLLGTGAPAGAGATATAELGIELALAGGPGQVHWGGQAGLSLTARLVRPGRNGWVAGDLSWTRLEVLAHGSAYRASQIRLLRELYALYLASNDLGSYGYRYGQDRWIEFSTIGSRRLWPLLDEAAAHGLTLIHPGRRSGPAGYEEAGFCLDVTRGEDGGLEIVPVVRASGDDAGLPVVFIGAEGHGAVCVDRDRDPDGDPGQWPFRLARLARPVPPALQRMALQGTPLRVPAADEPRFLRQYSPRLRQAAELTCSDGSVALPSISGPELVLQAGYGDDHRLDLSWAWEYRIGDVPEWAPLPPGGQEAGYRDPGAERAVLMAVAGGACRGASTGWPGGAPAWAARWPTRCCPVPSSPAWPPCGSPPSCCRG